MVFVPSGNEFRVNSQTGGDQFASDVAMLSNGGFVVVWDDRSGTLGDGSSDSIKAQLYAPSGAPVGREFLVNTRTIGAQSQPSVAALPDGRFIVTWTGVDDGSETSIQAQIFDNHGFRIGTEFGVNTQLSSSQTMPDVAALADGGFIITWSDAFDTNVKARRFDALGNGLAEFQVNGATAGLEDSSRVAVQTNAAPVIAWEDESGAHDNSADGIVAHDYISKFNLDFLVNTSTTGPQRVPDVAALAGGGFVVCWQDENSTSGDIKARIFKNGIGGTEFLVNTTTTAMQVDPAITATADGGFVIAWHDHSAGITDANVKAQAFDATGAAIGTELAVNTQTSLNQIQSAIAGLADHGFVAVWTDASGTLGDASGFSIKAQLYQLQPTTGTPGDDSFTASAGSNRFDALGGTDTVTFDFRLVDATVTWLGNAVIVKGPSGTSILTGFERYAFTDGTVENNDANVLVDDLFYYARNHDVWNAHADADNHFAAFGWREWRDPDAFFSTAFYLAVNGDVKAAGVDPLAHFAASGWSEGRQPSPAFDITKYLQVYPDVAAAQVNPLAHFFQFGAGEGRQPIALTSLTTSNGFDYVYYLAHNPDVAAAHVDPFQHFQQFGWQEGRNPNALFDTSGYLAHYADVAAAGVNPLDHYDSFGWQEGRDPSVNFDTTAYLGYPDVAAAHINPLVHYFQSGYAEGRAIFADGVWG